MLMCEGYKMFKGAMKVTYAVAPEQVIEGTWLYKPDCDCWYCSGSSYPADICTVVTDNTK